MNDFEFKVLETIILFFGTFLISLIIRKVVNKFAKVSLVQNPRRKRVILRSLNILILLLFILALSIVWGIDHKEVLVFASSVFAIIGVALFAQWSILSNITAGAILFFSFPYRIGDRIKVLNKDFPVEGTIEDVTLFFIYIKDDEGFFTTIPNNTVLQNGMMKLK